MEIDSFFIYIIAAGIFIFFLIFALFSIAEKEIKATKRAFLLAFLLPMFFLSLNLVHSSLFVVLRWIVVFFIFFGTIIILLPIYPERLKLKNQTPKSKIDERNVMFARAELLPGTENYFHYYSMRPENKTTDDYIRSLPGLLSKKASKYEKYTFAAATANFKTVEHFKHQVDADIKQKKEEIDVQEMTKFLKKWLRKLGAVDVGITELKDYHLYSFRGRNYNYSQKVEQKYKYAIAIVVEMNEAMIKDAPNAPTIMESSQQYLVAGNLAMQLAWFIRQFGYKARAHIDGNYEVVCPLVARDAGLGEIGRMGLLMTPNYGPRVRIAVVTTSMPLIVDDKKDLDTITSFCNFCKKCADNCPSQAISKQAPKIINGVKRWQINQEKCYSYWAKIGTDCARCIAVCPFSHPNNILHNFVRFFILKSYLFARFALLMDDFFYDRHPKARQPRWLKEFIEKK
jgi:reductive dehalogenase